MLETLAFRRRLRAVGGAPCRSGGEQTPIVTASGRAAQISPFVLQFDKNSMPDGQYLASACAPSRWRPRHRDIAMACKAGAGEMQG